MYVGQFGSGANRTVEESETPVVSRPKVSIVIPVYNGSNYMREAINSALGQTYDMIEVIVVNDGSADDGRTERIALSYGNRIRYLAKENGGVASALNLGIQNMTGEYFSWLSHDDMYTPDKIERQVEAATEYGKPAVVYSDFCTFAQSTAEEKNHFVTPKAAQSMRALLAIGMEDGIHGCALLVPRELFDRYGAFNPELKCTQDYDVWFRFAGKEPFVYAPGVLVLSRQHRAQGSKQMPVLCTTEADNLHSRLVGDLSLEEVTAYAEGNAGFLVNAYWVYRNAGYLKTSFRLLDHLCRLGVAVGSEDPAATLVNAEILMGSQDKAESIWRDQIVPALRTSKTKPKVMVYTNVWFRGGVERVLSTVMNSLADKFSFVLVTLDKPWDNTFELDSRIPWIKLTEVSPETIAARVAALAVLVHADVVVGNPNIMWEFLNVYELLQELNIRSIACNHGYYFLPYQYEWLSPVVERRLAAYKHATAVTWLTAFSAQVYAQLARNSVLLPNPNTFVDVPVETHGQAAKVVLCVGRFYDAVKRVDRALLAFELILKEHPDAELVLVGGYNMELHVPTDSDETVGDLVKRLAIPESRVRFEGEVLDVERYYAHASVLIMTSDSEGFSLVLTEAGQYGVPCVLFDVPGLEDIIMDGENGFIVPQDDVGAMAASVSRILADPKLSEGMSARARDLAARFNQDAICGKWELLIDNLLSMAPSEAVSRFVPPIRDAQTFARRMAGEYEKNINTLISRRSLLANVPKVPSLQGDGARPESRGRLAKVRDTLRRPTIWSKLVVDSLKQHGLRVTAVKILRKLRRERID